METAPVARRSLTSDCQEPSASWGILSARSETGTGSLNGIGSFTAAGKLPGTPETDMTPQGAALTLVAMVVGAGVITLPASVGDAGVICGFGMIIFCGIIAIDSGRILCEATSIADELGFDVRCFEDLGEAAFGKVGKAFTLVAMQTFYFGIASIFMLLIGQYASLIVDTLAQKDANKCEGVFPLLMQLNGVTYGGFITIAALIAIPTLFLKDMQAVSKLAPVSIGGAICLIGCLGVGSVVDLAWHSGSARQTAILVSPPDLHSVLGIFLKALFSYAGVSAVPAMRREMSEKNKIKISVTVAMTIVMLVYALACIPAIIAFGQPSDELLKDLQLGFLYLGSAAIVVHVLIALPGYLNVFFNCLSVTVLPIMATINVTSLLIRFAVLFLAYIVPMMFSSVSGLIDLISAITLVSTMIYYPIIFHVKLLAMKEGSWRTAVKKIGGFACIWQIIMLCLGTVALIVGVYSSLAELAQKPKCPL